MLALGGHRALSQTASQADIVMHSRIFYYARIRGVTIPYSPYRHWLRAQLATCPDPPRIWEWDLLQALCNHRDRIAGSLPSDQARATAAEERGAWVRQLLDDGPPAATNGHDQQDSSKPAWMAAAPRAELYVDRQEDENGADGQAPYPERFAAIIKAVQTGEPVEGIVEIPDLVARNPVSPPPKPADIAVYMRCRPNIKKHEQDWSGTDFDRQQPHLAEWIDLESLGRKTSLCQEERMTKGLAWTVIFLTSHSLIQIREQTEPIMTWERPRVKTDHRSRGHQEQAAESKMPIM